MVATIRATVGEVLSTMSHSEFPGVSFGRAPMA